MEIGVTYWPSTKGVTWWERHDSGEVRDDFAHLAALGITTLRLHLLWEAFQPRLDRVGTVAMSTLEQALDAAQANGLQVLATMFAGAISGAVFLPTWATTSSSAVDLAHMQRAQRRGRANTPVRLPVTAPIAARPRRPVVFEHGYRRTIVRDLYADPVLLEAQHYLIREVVGYFAAHPALARWELGHQMELALAPRSPDAFAEWQLRLMSEAREQGARSIAAAISLRAFARPKGPRVEYLAEIADTLLAVADTPPALRLPARPALEEAALALALVRTLAPTTQVIVDNVGMASATADQRGWIADEMFGNPRPSFLADEEYQGYALGDQLRWLAEHGAAGVILRAAYDYSPTLWRHPPLTYALGERSAGLLRTDGSEKPAAVAVQQLAVPVRAASVPLPPILDLGLDPEAIYHDPERMMQRLLRDLVQSEDQSP